MPVIHPRTRNDLRSSRLMVADYHGRIANS
jgi:hypothetical protein